MRFSIRSRVLKKRTKKILLVLFIAFSIISLFINIQLIRSSYGNLKRFNSLSISQFYLCRDSAQISKDGTGGAIAVWDDDRGSDCDIYAQRVNSTGSVLWTKNGVDVCTAENDQDEPQISCDGAGNAIIAWLDSRNAADSYDWKVYAQRLNTTGDKLWLTTGAPICTITGSKYDLHILPDGTGGAIITWVDYRSVNSGLYAQRINSSGDVKWMTNGLPICLTTSYVGTTQICSDGNDGAIITWQDERSGNRDIYAQRINSSGDVLWTTNGVEICAASNYQGFPQLCTDGMNGAIITWRDQRLGPSHIYAQRINSTGEVQWTPDGEVICIAADVQVDQQICSDGLNGAFITWHTWVIDSSEESDIYAQRINSSGEVQWMTNGIPVCTTNGRQSIPQICESAVGSAIITWLDNGDVYAQTINSTGGTEWVTNGVPICTESSPQSEQKICIDGAEGAIILWQDARYPKPSFYAQRINSTGEVQWSVNGIPLRTDGEGVSGFVSGFNLFLLLGILSVGVFLLRNKIKKS